MYNPDKITLSLDPESIGEVIDALVDRIHSIEPRLKYSDEKVRSLNEELDYKNRQLQELVRAQTQANKEG